MSTKSKAGTAALKPILKGVVVHAQPHALLRPGRAAGGVAINKSASSDLEQVRASAYAQGRAARAAEEAQALELAFATAREQGFEAGHKAGLESGLAKGQLDAKEAMSQASAAAMESARERIQQLERLIASAHECASALRWEAEDDLVAMSYELVCRIVGEQAASPASLREVARQMLAGIDNASRAALHVHPDDHRALMLDADVDGEQVLRWVADPEVALGGMVVRSRNATLDARLETQFHVLQSTLAQHREQRRSEGDR
jgi:flagellar assembly protein FliH